MGADPSEISLRHVLGIDRVQEAEPGKTQLLPLSLPALSAAPTLRDAEANNFNYSADAEYLCPRTEQPVATTAMTCGVFPAEASADLGGLECGGRWRRLYLEIATSISLIVESPVVDIPM